MQSSFFRIILFFPLITGCVPIDNTQTSAGTSSRQAPAKTLYLANYVYEPQIKTVQLNPAGQAQGAALEPAAIQLNSNQQLLLSFDELTSDYQQYYAKIIHCNWDWTPSNITPMEYLYEYNEFPINTYEYSYNTRTPYVHYSLEVPKVKLSGNYVLTVYRGRDPEDVILSRRFMVYSNEIALAANLTLPTGVSTRRENHQVEIALDYSKLGDVMDPVNQIKVVVRQNQRWDNAIYDLRPTSVQQGLNRLEYRHFDLSNNFMAGNEYRLFDLRSVNAKGQNIGRIVREEKHIDAFLTVNQPRSVNAYAQYRDLNGEFIVANLDYSDPEISSEYVNVHFYLKTEEPLPSPVYVAGEFTNYLEIPQYQMTYDSELEGYTNSQLLKQGWYSYLLLSQDPTNPFAIEGSFSETENFYEVLVYYKSLNRRNFELVGYSSFSSRR